MGSGPLNIVTEALPQTYLGNSLAGWLEALGIFLATLLVLWLLRRWVHRGLRRWASSTSTMVDDVVIDVLDRTRPLFLLLFAAWAASQVLEISAGTNAVLATAAIVVVLFQIGLWASTALAKWLEIIGERRAAEGDALTWLSAVEWAGKVAIWMVIGIVGLENLGVDVTGLATGLGIGGLALALAVQSVLGDLFSAFTIYLDRPFLLGDFLVVGDLRGTVEDIGLKTTRLRSLSGEQLIFSNSDLLNSRIRNFGRLVERRVSFTVGVTYDTPEEKVARIPALIREVVAAQEKARIDRCHFKEFGDSALMIETVYFVEVPEYHSYMDVQQAVNLELMRRFAAEGIEFAFPTQTILLGAGDRPAGTTPAVGTTP